MTADEAALLAAVAADPADDHPRLVYADWLDDHGHPLRAQFIRAQIARYHAHDNPDRVRALEEVEGAAYADLDELFHPWGFAGCTFFEFERGFPHELTVSPELLLDHPAWIAGMVPPPARVVVDGVGRPRDGRLVALLGCPGAVAVTHLHLTGRDDKDTYRLTHEDVIALAAGPHLTRLHHLDAAASTALGLRRMLDADPFPALAELNLRQNDLGNDAVTLLAGWPGLRRLRRLWLGSNNLTDAGADRLIAGRFAPPSFDVLGLDWNPLTDAGRGRLCARFGPGVYFEPEDARWFPTDPDPPNTPF